MSVQTISPRIRGFIAVNAHPAGCAENVRTQIALAKQGGSGSGLGHALVLGASTGYGLSSLLTTVFGYGADAVAVAFERPPKGERTASGGWYNLAAATRFAREAGRDIAVVNGDAFTDALKRQTIDLIKARGAKLDSVVYSLASPKRTDPKTGLTHESVLKPIGAPYISKSIALGSDELTMVEIPPASDAEIEATRKVMGGEDWELWIKALLEADVLAKGCRTVAYSYIGPELTYPIYRSGTIGKAKEHLEATARALDGELRARVGGAAYVSVNKALVTQASSAIPVVPLYISGLYKIMKDKGTHEGTGEQIVRLFRDHLAPGRTPKVDAAGRIRVDDLEMQADVQARILELWAQVTTENLLELTDYEGFKREFRTLFGFDVDGIDYTQPVETNVTIP
jgi:enoyl-[acyl-carrier protein] reductase / trans-2-enoyl-CoA reductase (NAD+)